MMSLPLLLLLVLVLVLVIDPMRVRVGRRRIEIRPTRAIVFVRECGDFVHVHDCENGHGVRGTHAQSKFGGATLDYEHEHEMVGGRFHREAIT